MNPNGWTHWRSARAQLHCRLLLAGLALASGAIGGCAATPGDAPVGGALAPRGGAPGDLDRRAMQLLERAAGGDVDVVRANAIEALVQVAPAESTTLFAAAVDAPEPLVRFAALVALGDVRHKAALTAIRARRGDSDARVRLAASYAAYRCGDADAAQTLVRTLKQDASEGLRSDAAYLIGKLDEPKAHGWLSFLAMNEKSSVVRVSLQAALARLGDKRALEQVIAYTQGDRISRLVALQSLIELRSPRAREPLRYTLADPNEYLENRLLAARALGALGSPEGYALAMSALSNNAQDITDRMRQRSLAALALGAIGRRDALAALAQVAADPSDQRVQVAAAFAILQITRGR